MKILAVSDVELSTIYSPIITQRFQGVDMVVSCGDLPYYYLEYIISMLNVPLFYVHGNHQNSGEYGQENERHFPWGAVYLNERVKRGPGGVLLAGISGCLQYNFGPYQYSQEQMWLKVFELAPALLLNKLRYGRYLDIFVTHAPPWKIHDMDDRPHQGIRAYRWLNRVFRPAYHLHGHIHIYRQDAITETQYEQTCVMNAYGYKILEYTVPG